MNCLKSSSQTATTSTSARWTASSTLTAWAYPSRPAAIFLAPSASRPASRKPWPPAANSAASVPPMFPVPMIATVFSEVLTVICLS